MSRKTTPAEKRRRGTLRPSREKPLSLRPLESVPKPPSYLSGQAAHAYHVFASLLFDSGRLARSDLYAVVGLAQAYCDWAGRLRPCCRARASLRSAAQGSRRHTENRVESESSRGRQE